MVIGTPGKLHHCSNKCVWERRRSHKCLLECKIDEDSSCKEEKVEDFVFKLEEVVETKVAYFYTPSPKNSKVSDHDSNLSQTMTLTPCPVGRV